MRWLRGLSAPAVLLLLGTAFSSARADGRQLEIRFTPTARMTYALWITSADGTIFETIRLTEAVGRFGIGNRPGASQMNSGFRWPYGRRENVLPIWAHARIAAGGEPFRRVIFQDRTSEGWASRSSNDSTRDEYFCLSFDSSTTRREALDAVSCASVFMSDKGRFLTEADLRGGCPTGAPECSQEPYEMRPGIGMMLPMTVTSVYPPRRDLASACVPSGPDECANHPDIVEINLEAERVIPNIDSISRATPRGDVGYEVVFDVPDDWPDGDYFLWLEANVEGDYNETYNERTYPTPTTPEDKWDYWAENYGYPYRGQPSVVYRIDLTIDGAGGTFGASRPFGYADVNGRDGTIRPIDATISDDPTGAAGSGADRLRMGPGGDRIAVEIPPTNVCGVPDPPPECAMECGATNPCPSGFTCGPEGMCVGRCDIFIAPGMVRDFTVERHPDIKNAHHWARLTFVVPEAERPIERYEVRFSTLPIVDDDSFEDAQPARTASLESEDLVIDTTGVSAGDTVEAFMGGLTPETHYFVAIRAVDDCNDQSAFAVAEVTTTEIHFTTVSPCFVATAAYGTPMADEIRSLRRLRDRHLLTHAPGRALVSVYEDVGPPLARTIQANETLRTLARVGLSPAVLLATALED